MKNLDKLIAEQRAAERDFEKSVAPEVSGEEKWIKRGEQNITHLKKVFPNKHIPPHGSLCEICKVYVSNDRSWRVNMILSSQPLITCLACSNLGSTPPLSFDEVEELLEPKVAKVIMSRAGMDQIMYRSKINVRNLAAVSGIAYSSFRYKLESSGFTLKEYQRLMTALRLLGATEPLSEDT